MLSCILVPFILYAVIKSESWEDSPLARQQIEMLPGHVCDLDKLAFGGQMH